MIRIVCRTNLDIEPFEKWPNELPCVPRVGDKITSVRKGTKTKGVTLQVCGVHWRPNKIGRWIPYVEMTFPSFFQNVSEFENYYSRIKNRGVQSKEEDQ